MVQLKLPKEDYGKTKTSSKYNIIFFSFFFALFFLFKTGPGDIYSVIVFTKSKWSGILSSTNIE